MGMWNIAMLLVLVGALNWGAVGLLKKDLVALALGSGSTAARVVYVAVGLAAVLLVLKKLHYIEGFEEQQVMTCPEGEKWNAGKKTCEKAEAEPKL